MGGLTSNRKRGEDFFKLNSPILSSVDPFYGHISKKSKLSDSLSETSSSVCSSSSVVSRISKYPDTKPGFKREVSGPVPNSRFRNFLSFGRKSHSINSSSKGESSFERMGNLNARLQSAKETAFKTLRFFRKENDGFVERKKEKEVIEIIDDDDEEEEGIVGGSSEDSSVEEVKIGDSVFRDKLKKGGDVVKVLELDSSEVTDASNVNKVERVEKMMDFMQLDGEGGYRSGLAYKRLHDDARKRDVRLSSLDFEIALYLKQVERQSLMRPQKKVEEAEKLQDLAKECFTPLTEEEQAGVHAALSNLNRRKVLVTHQNSNIDITVEKFKCLSPGAWLNDEVINVYLELLKEREKREPKKFLKCHFFSTFFYKKLISGKDNYNFQSVRRWTTQRKLGYSLSECDKIFVPIHQQIHWCLAIINKKEQKFQYLDSLGGVDYQVLEALARYYVDEVKDKNGRDIDVSSWAKEFVKDLPEQRNGYDCGVFMIKYADFYSRDIGLCFSQDDMPYFRLRTAKEIMKLRAE